MPKRALAVALAITAFSVSLPDAPAFRLDARLGTGAEHRNPVGSAAGVIDQRAVSEGHFAYDGEAATGPTPKPFFEPTEADYASPSGQAAPSATPPTTQATPVVRHSHRLRNALIIVGICTVMYIVLASAAK